MNLAAAAPVPAFCSLAEDRSLGTEGSTLRESIAAATSLPIDDRGDEIYFRIAAALNEAEQEHGILVNPETFGRTLELLNLLPLEIPLPDVVVESETEIGLDWDEGASRVLSLTVRDIPLIGFAALFGVEPLYGRVALTEEIPETLRFLFRRLYPSSRGR